MYFFTLYPLLFTLYPLLFTLYSLPFTLYPLPLTLRLRRRFLAVAVVAAAVKDVEP